MFICGDSVYWGEDVFLLLANDNLRIPRNSCALVSSGRETRLPQTHSHLQRDAGEQSSGFDVQPRE